MNMRPETMYNSQDSLRDPQGDTPIGLVALWRILKRNTHILLLPAVVFAILAGILSLQGADTYSAEAQLILTRDNIDIIELDSSDRETVDSAVVAHAVNILNSRTLAQDIAEDIDLKNDPTVNPYLSDETPVEQPGMVRRVLYALGLSTPRDTSDAASRGQAETDYLLDWLQSSYVAQAVPNSNVVVVQAQTENPVLSANIANAAIDSFLSFSLNASQHEAEQAINALAERVQSLRLQVHTDHSALQQAQATARGATPEMLLALSSQLADLKAKEAEITAEVAALGQILTDLDSLATAGPDAIAKTLADDTDLRSYVRIALARAPSVQTATDDLAAVRASVLETYTRLQRQEASLISSRQDLDARLNVANESTMNLNRLEVELETTNAVYASALGRLKELTMESGLRNAGGRFLARAVPPIKADRQGRRRMVVIAIVLGVLVGATIVLIREASNERIRSLSDSQSTFSALARVEVPWLRTRFFFANSRRKDKYLTGQNSGFSEAVRNCRRMILEQTDTDVPQVISVISALPGEGKSTLCGALASSFALIGKKTLVIDADMRAQGLTMDIFGHPQEKGLQQAILSHPENHLDFVMEIPDLGLHCVPAGLDPKNPADLLERPEFPSLIADLSEKYSIILIDTPPMLMFPDARSAAEVSTHTIMVAGYNQTPRSALNEVLALLPAAVLSSMTMVLCKVPNTAAARFGAKQQHAYY